MNNFVKACEMSLNDWLATIPDEIPKAEYTKNHEKWLKKLFNKMRDNRYHVFTTKTVKVLLVAAVLSALLLTAFVIPSSREYIIDNFNVFSRYRLTEANNNSVSGEITVGYIPDGFELELTSVKDKYIIYKYVSNENDHFTIIKQSSSTKVEFDTEKVTFEYIYINENTFMYYVDAQNCGYLLWNKNDYVYQTYGSISKDELLKIAETVK